MKTTTMKTLTAIASSAMLSVTGVSAAIVIDSSFAGNERVGFGSQTHIVATGLNASGSDKLVIAVATEHDFGGTSTPNVPSISFDGVSLLQGSTQASSTSSRVSIFYLDNPGTGDLIYSETGGSNGSSWSVFLLSGTAGGIGATSGAAADTAGLTTTGDNSFVLSGHVADGPTPMTVFQTADAPQTELFVEQWNPGRIYGSLGTASQDGGASGSSVTATWTNGNAGTYGRAITISEFTAAPIPEPSTTALLGLGGLALILRRRK